MMKSENSENSRDIDAARILPLLMNWKCGGEVALNRYFVPARETFADWADAHQIGNTEILLANELAMAVSLDSLFVDDAVLRSAACSSTHSLAHSSAHSLARSSAHSLAIKAINNLDSRAAWSMARVALKNMCPEIELESSIAHDQAETHLTPCERKYPEPFTVDLGKACPPFVSTHFDGSVNGLVLIAHEFGHAVQIVATSRHSGKSTSRVPPAAREVCALLSEIAMLRHLNVGYRIRQPHTNGFRGRWCQYLGTSMRALIFASKRPDTPYDASWDYALAATWAISLVKTKSTDLVTRLFRFANDFPTITPALLTKAIACGGRSG